MSTMYLEWSRCPECGGSGGSLMTERDLARRWQVSPGHLSNQRSAGDGPPYIKLGKAVRYRIDDIEKYERANTQE
jgi:hypothetical protein